MQEVKDATEALGFPGGRALVMGIVLAVYFGVLMWVGLVLRRPGLLEVVGLSR